MVITFSITPATREPNDGGGPKPQETIGTPPTETDGARKPKRPLFFVGIVLPVAYAAVAFWSGFINKSMCPKAQAEPSYSMSRIEHSGSVGRNGCSE